jgi:hypothetical protein
MKKKLAWDGSCATWCEARMQMTIPKREESGGGADERELSARPPPIKRMMRE